MGIRADFWKTFSVLKALDASDLAKSFMSGEERNGSLISLMTGRFEKELVRHNLTVDVAALHSAGGSFEWFLTNLFLYSEYLDSYVSMAGFQLARLCAQLHYQPADVFLNDWLCMSKKEILLEQLGPEQYYSSSIYLSHLWVENVAARRIFFARQIQALANSMGLRLSESRILDVGSGMGGTLRLFTDAQERIGIDISEPMVHWCNETSNEGERYAVMDSRSLDFPENWFDIILSFDVLEHILEPRLALQEMARVVRPSGVVAIVYPFGSDDWDSHISLVRKSTFDGWLRRSGYEVLAEATAPREVYPCSVCYLLRAS